ncbi:protein PF14_0175-like [Teleopsis dalmanni]|uniref:protein PF14_0175-like n=1 Tax=Teleopsis dalmanni TaxID=139649 RepID=UPI0018CD63B4|nr:protein PF14_0175-like [Teleopsis dalmanni]XP_037946611.1 protein PF14_0175-like [Teleopsis dalmanni]
MNILLRLSKNIGRSSNLLRNSLKVAVIRPNVIQNRTISCGEHDQKNSNLIKSLCSNALLNRSYSKHSNTTNEVEQGTREKSDGKDDKEALKVDEYEGNKVTELIVPSNNTDSTNEKQNIVTTHISVIDASNNNKCDLQSIPNDDGTLNTKKNDTSIIPSTNVCDNNNLNQNIINTHITDIDTSNSDKYGLQNLAIDEGTLKTNKNDESTEPFTNVVDINHLNQNIINAHIPDMDSYKNDKMQTLANDEGTLKTNKNDESTELSTNAVNINNLNQNIINAHIPDIDSSNNDKCVLQTLANDDGTLNTNKNCEIVIDINHIIQNTINNHISDIYTSNNDKYDLNFIPNNDNTSNTNELAINNYRKDEKSIEPFINVTQYNIQITDMSALDDDIVSWSREFLIPINDLPTKPSDYISTFKKLFKSSKAYNKSKNFQNINTHIPHIDVSENEESSLNFLVELIDNDIISKLTFLGKWSNLEKSNVPVDTAVAWKEEENCYMNINTRSENNKYRNWFMIATDIGTFAIYINPPISNLSTIMGLLVHTDLKIKWYTGRPRINLSTSIVNSFENKKHNTYNFLFVTRDAEGALEINTAPAIPEPKEQDHLEHFVENKRWHYSFLKITNEGMCYINIDPIYNSSSMFDGLFVPSNYHICWNKHYPIVNIIIPSDNRVSKYWYGILVSTNSEGRIQINVLPYYECIGAIRRNEGYRIINTHIPPGFYSNATKIMVHSVYQHNLPRSGTLDKITEPPTDDTIELNENENVVIDILTPEDLCNNNTNKT